MRRSPSDLRDARRVSAERINVALAPLAKVPGATPVRFSMSSAITPADPHEKLVEVLHGFGQRRRGTVLDAVHCKLLGCDVNEIDVVSENISENLDLLPTGEGLRPVEDVAVADVAVGGQYVAATRAMSSGSTTGWVP